MTSQDRSSWHGMSPVLGTPSEWAVSGWPEWAFLPPEEVYDVLPFRIASIGTCSSHHGAPLGESSAYARPVEPPYRSHCLPCIAAARRITPPPRPHPLRDRGLCVGCGEPAKLNDNAYQGLHIVLGRLEAFGGTLARYCTTRFCYSCDPASPRCRSRVCVGASVGDGAGSGAGSRTGRGRGRPAALPRGCCWRTSRGFPLVHCRECCARSLLLKSLDSADRRGRCATQNCPSPCRARACREAGRGEHPGRTDCCAQARKSPHCAFECARARAVRDAFNQRRGQGLSAAS